MRMLRYAGFTIMIIFCSLAIISCGGSGGSSAKTAKEFVEKYAKAYTDGDVDRVLKMTAVDKGKEESFKDETKSDVKSKGFGYRAWSNTRYVSEEDKGTYIRVNVEVNRAPSSIVLLKQEEGILRLALNPSDYQ